MTVGHWILRQRYVLDKPAIVIICKCACSKFPKLEIFTTRHSRENIYTVFSAPRVEAVQKRWPKIFSSIWPNHGLKVHLRALIFSGGDNLKKLENRTSCIGDQYLYTLPYALFQLPFVCSAHGVTSAVCPFRALISLLRPRKVLSCFWSYKSLKYCLRTIGTAKAGRNTE